MMKLPTREEGLLMDSMLGMSPKYRKKVLRDQSLATLQKPVPPSPSEPEVLVPRPEQLC